MGINVETQENIDQILHKQGSK
eukprot:SAG31_NODE_1662_length_7590_cov_24.800828_7_plen_21_part_01